MNFYTDKLMVEERRNSMLQEAQRHQLAKMAQAGEQHSRGGRLMRVIRVFGSLHPYIVSVKATKQVAQEYPTTACAEG